MEVYLRGVAEQPAVPETWLARRQDVPDLVRAGLEVGREAVLTFVSLCAADSDQISVLVVIRRNSGHPDRLRADLHGCSVHPTFSNIRRAPGRIRFNRAWDALSFPR